MHHSCLGVGAGADASAGAESPFLATPSPRTDTTSRLGDEDCMARQLSPPVAGRSPAPFELGFPLPAKPCRKSTPRSAWMRRAAELAPSPCRMSNSASPASSAPVSSPLRASQSSICSSRLASV